MSSDGTGNIVFGLHFSMTLQVVSSTASSDVRKFENETAPQPCIDAKEASLSPITQRLQQDIRQRRHAQQEVRQRAQEKRNHQQAQQTLAENDAESLYQLEVATALSSQEAKIKDQESLELLLHCTNLLKESLHVYKTSKLTSFWPRFRYIKGLNGSPLSCEPSFSTPSIVKGQVGRLKGLNGSPLSCELTPSTPSLAEAGRDHVEDYSSSFGSFEPFSGAPSSIHVQAERNQPEDSNDSFGSFEQSCSVLSSGKVEGSFLDKCIKNSPLSHELSATATSGLDVETGALLTVSEFEDFLAKEVGAKHYDQEVTNKASLNIFSALLASQRSSEVDGKPSNGMSSEYIKEQAQSVFEVMAKAKQQDIDDEQTLEQNLAEAMTSPPDSPTMQIKHLPKSTTASLSTHEETENEPRDADDKCSGQMSLLSETKVEAKDPDAGSGFDTRFEDKSDDEDWVEV